MVRCVNRDRPLGRCIVKLAGFTVGYVVRVGIAALIFFLLFKALARKSGSGTLQRVAAAA